MYQNRTVLILIPARGGSTRLPHKNVRRLGGIPLIQHAVRAATRSKYADRVIVSTDDRTIARIAKRAGAEIPFMRPQHLATSTSPVIRTIIHALAYFKKKESWVPDIVVVVQATSPFVLARDIDSAIKTLVVSKKNSCVTVCPVRERPEWMFTLSGRTLTQRYPSKIFERSQDMPALYRLNGAVCASYSQIILKKQLAFDPRDLAGVIMPEERSIDIDYPADLEAARKMR